MGEGRAEGGQKGEGSRGEVGECLAFGDEQDKGEGRRRGRTTREEGSRVHCACVCGWGEEWMNYLSPPYRSARAERDKLGGQHMSERGWRLFRGGRGGQAAGGGVLVLRPLAADGAETARADNARRSVAPSESPGDCSSVT
jgi:hypothetical protein